VLNWPPYFVLDMNPTALLPAGWEADVQLLAEGIDRQKLVTAPSPEPADGESWSFSVVTGDRVQAQLDWLWRLYHGQFRAFASERFGAALYPANRLDATTTLNVLEGRGAGNEWHRDTNPVSGLFFATSLAPGDGGALQFRSPDGQFSEIRPYAGLFVCFDGSCEHQVAPLLAATRRLSFPMTYYSSAVDQPFANENNRYEL
jgi:hypothetical protein